MHLFLLFILLNGSKIQQTANLPHPDYEKQTRFAYADSSQILGTWTIDLRPTPNSEAYLKEFKFTKITGKTFDGEFYGYPFNGGFLNTDWDKIYFAFTTSDQSGTYYHSGSIDGDKIVGITLNENRQFVLPWSGYRKK